VLACQDRGRSNAYLTPTVIGRKSLAKGLLF
jgi:hypothetical protein